MIKLESKQITMEGTVETVLFLNAENGYTVIELDHESELVTVVGCIGQVDEGEVLSLQGEFVNHQKFGTQFKAEYCERKLPETAISIQKYLSSGIIKGLGPTLAKRIVKEFGDDTLNVMEREPQKLLMVKGISPNKCEKIIKESRQIFNVRTLMCFFSQFGIQASFAMKAFQRWGFYSLDLIKDNPYSLCGAGIWLEFDKAEQIAQSERIPNSAPIRISAGIRHILQININAGHSCVPLDTLVSKACSFLDIGEKEFYEQYNIDIKEENIFEYVKKEREFVFLPEYYKSEKYISERLSVLYAFMSHETADYESLIDIEEMEKGIEYETLQRKAISDALSQGLIVLTGGPGTGKTTTLNAIISLYEKQGLTVMVAAPTGRAAKRISDLTGYDAKTIHRLLEVEFSAQGELKFKHDEENPLSCEVLIIDEMSMVDSLLFESLLRALKLSCRIIMVGDSDQLPSVGAGNVLKDLIESNSIPVVELKEIFRQAQKSCIITNAHKIVSGKLPDLSQKNSDFFFFQRLETESAAEFVLELYSKRLPSAYKINSVENIQILSPTRKGPLGTVELNKAIQQIVNPSTPAKAESKAFLYTFREGDKIMQTKNNYDIVWTMDGEQGTGIFNGDIGRIVKIQKYTHEVMINFDGRVASYTIEMLEQIELAYAITVHKSQGSEFDIVIMPILGGYEKLYYRNLLYTAVTRAKRMMIIVGSKNKIEEMVNNNRRSLRYTCLKEQLTSQIQK